MRQINLFTENFILSGYLRNLVKKFLGRSSLGPQKVQINLIAGLKMRNVKVEVNKLPDAHAELCVLSGPKVVESLVRRGYNQIVIGPNISAKAMAEIYIRHHKSIKTILAPSQEVKEVYTHFGIPADRVTIWAVGIDIYKFPEVSSADKNYDALVYFKRRTRVELGQVKELLESEKQSYTILEYGSYTEADFKNSLRSCRYAVVLDGTESQGIALQEIMASNLPMFVFDQIYLGDDPDLWLRENLRGTSVPYWDDICGVRIATDLYGKSSLPYFSIPEARGALRQFIQQLPKFNPRQFVLENLELAVQADKFVQIMFY